MMDKEMDGDMKEKMVDELEKMGIDKDMIDERMLWGAKKMMFGMMKMRWAMKENGMDDEKAQTSLKKIVDKMMAMDMAEKMEKMEKMKDHDHHEHCSSCHK